MSQTLVNPAPPPAPQAPGARQWAALAVLTLAVTLLAIDSTVLALAIPSLSADLGPTPPSCCGSAMSTPSPWPVCW